MRAHLSFPSCLFVAVALLGGCSDSPTGPDLLPGGRVLLVTPSTGSVAVRGTLQLSATAPGSNQSLAPSSELVWSSSDEQVAGVTGKGVVFGRAAGRAEIVAQWNGLQGSSQIVVVATPILKPPPPGNPCPAILLSAKREVNATTAIPTCREQ
jgi:uncharacterized protein YjdB